MSLTKKRRCLAVGLAVTFVIALAGPAWSGEGPALESEPVGPTPIEPAEPEPALPEPAAPAAAPEASPETSSDASQDTSSKPSTGNLTEEQRQHVLDHPTKNIDLYQDLRAEDLHKRSLPDYAISLIVSPKVFGKVDLRQPAMTGFDQTNPTLFGVALGYDHTLIQTKGVLSLGVDLGIYGSSLSNPYGGLITGFISAYPHVIYEALFLQKQWVVPTIRAGVDLVRYSYSFENQAIAGFKELPRVDLGGLIYLNLFEPTSAADMKGNFGIKRTYVGAFLTLENDSTQKDFNMTDHSLRIMLRFEE